MESEIKGEIKAQIKYTEQPQVIERIHIELTYVGK